MSDQIEEFDQIFRERLSDQTATPPPAVWEGIQSQRTFGHVVANKISQNWRIFGTLLMLLLAGGSSFILFGEEEKHLKAEYQTRILEITEWKNLEVDLMDKHVQLPLERATSVNEPSVIQHQVSTELDVVERGALPAPEAIASLQQAAFVRPDIVDNKKLSAYIELIDGWETAEPFGVVRYYHMDDLEKSKYLKKEITKLLPKKVEVDYDYVFSGVKRKSFKERSSMFLSFTPHMIQKSMKADYNLSSSFLEDRKKAENTRLAYTFGALLHYEIKNHQFVETGINFTQIYEEMSFEGQKRFSNQYNFVEIPLLLGYQDRNAKWGWHIKGGLGVQVYNSYQGYILKRMDEFGGVENGPQFRSSGAVRNIINNNHSLHNNQARNEVVDLENRNENPFKTSGIVNMHLGAGITYYHSIRTSFLLTPVYKRSINSITKESASFTERITYTGITFGARFKL